jgi:hypothetical protein
VFYLPRKPSGAAVFGGKRSHKPMTQNTAAHAALFLVSVTTSFFLPSSHGTQV